MNEPTDPDASVATSLAAEVLQRFVNTTIFARIGNGSWNEDSVLTRFRLTLPGDSDVGLLQINDEDGCWTHPRAARSFAEGQTIHPSDLVSEFVPLPANETPRYIAGEWDGDQWLLDIHLAAPHPEVATYLEAGAEFFAAAAESLAAGRLRAFGENAFHAVEHLAKAELLSYVAIVPEVAEARTHAVVRSLYNRWASLGNTELRFAALLNELTEARRSSTYIQGDDQRSAETSQLQLEILRAMLDWVQAVERGDGPTSVNLVASQPIQAGQLMSREQASVHKPRG